VDLILYLFFLIKELVVSLAPILLFITILALLQKVSYNTVIELCGSKSIVYTGIVGTTLHEMSHFIMCVIFRYEVKEVRFFDPAPDGTLGFVKFSFDPVSLYQRVGLFFVGFAPFFMALLYFWLFTNWMLDIDLLKSSTSDVGAVISILNSLELLYFAVISEGWKGLCWLLVSLSVLLHMMPSKPDLEGATTGGIVLVILYFMICSIEYVIDGDVSGISLFIYETGVLITLFLMKLTSISLLVCVFLLSLYCLKSGIKRLRSLL